LTIEIHNYRNCSSLSLFGSLTLEMLGRWRKPRIPQYCSSLSLFDSSTFEMLNRWRFHESTDTAQACPTFTRTSGI
jgi:hypothetical protein